MKIMKMLGLMLICLPLITLAQEMPGMQIGVLAPDFEAENYKAETVKLSDLYKKGPVVLVFYRGGWCPYCNMHLQELQAHMEDFKRYNAAVVAVSVDKIQKAVETVDGKRLDFEVISNPQGDILEKYGLVYKVPEELNKKYKEKYNIDLEASSGRTDGMIAIPATYIIDESGTIVFAYANEDYKVRTKAEEILEALDQMK